jgi:hypothetical protein
MGGGVEKFSCATFPARTTCIRMYKDLLCHEGVSILTQIKAYHY